MPRNAPSSSLLPGLFCHRTTRARLLRPQLILIDFHGTISERRWEDKVIYPYVKRAVRQYLRNNWTNDDIQKCLIGLRNESFEQRFRNRYEDAPVIDDEVEGEDMDPMKLVDQMSDFLLWQLDGKKETRDSQVIERLVWQDGYQRGQISTPIFDDVMPSLKLWRDKYACRIYIISSIDNATLKLLLENTNKGNLSHYITGYVGSKKLGDKMISETYKQLYEELKSPVTTRESSNKQVRKTSSPIDTDRNLRDIKSRSPRTPDELARPVLFLTDSGQEAKAASQAGEGQLFECLLVNRPTNKRFRTYYLSRFQYVERFDDIEFVD